jgi:tetratricopeptide (TPR) repeat protein
LVVSNGAVDEHAAAGTVVGEVSASDPDADESFTYSLIEDANGRFAIDPDSGRLTVADNTGLDFEDAASHHVTVRVVDSGGLSHDETVAIALMDVNEAPRVEEAAFIVDENAADDTPVGRISASDPDTGEKFGYSLTEDAGGRFAIDAETGVITMVDGARRSYDGTASFALTVGVTDRGGLSDSATVTVKLNDSQPGRLPEDKRVSLIQQQLSDAGFDPGPMDGKMGPRTRAALEAYQHKYNLTEQPIEDLLDHMVASGHFVSAYNYQTLGNHEKSIKEYSMAIRIKSGFPEAYFNRGLIYYSQNHYDRAIEDFSAVIDLKPDDMKAYFIRADSYYEKGSYRLAVRDVFDAVKVGFSTWQIFSELGFPG